MCLIETLRGKIEGFVINFWPIYLLYSVKTKFFTHKENSNGYVKHFKYLATFLMRNKCAAVEFCLNTQNMTNSTLVSLVKMEYG